MSSWKREISQIDADLKELRCLRSRYKVGNELDKQDIAMNCMELPYVRENIDGAIAALTAFKKDLKRRV